MSDHMSDHTLDHTLNAGVKQIVNCMKGLKLSPQTSTKNEIKGRLSNGLLSDNTEITKFFETHFNGKKNWIHSKGFSAKGCRYCGIENQKCLIQCKICNYLFCNGGANNLGSCAVIHLVKARHKEISLYGEQKSIECYICGDRNAFLLGYVVVNIQEKRLLLCRTPCAFKCIYRKIKWNLEDWNPLIMDRTFVSWLVEVPSEEEQLMARHLSAKQIDKLENSKGKSLRPTFHYSNELEEPSKGLDIDSGFQYLNKLGVIATKSGRGGKPQNEFQFGYQYFDKFMKLVRMEDDYQQELKHKIKIRWIQGSRKLKASFIFPKTDTDMIIMRGDELKLCYLGKDNYWSGFAYVSSTSFDPKTNQQNVEIVMKSNKDVPIYFTSNFIVEFFWESVPFERVRKALNKFAKNDTSVSDYLHHKLLGHSMKDVVKDYKLPKELTAPNLPKLNPSQINAVKYSVERELSLIQGPPGTGKTLTSATIVYHLVKRVSKPVLVCAPSNVAVDHLTEKIHKTGVKVVKVCAKSREEKESPVSFLALHNLVKENESEIKRLKSKLNRSLSEEKELNRLIKITENKILNTADVICCTCIAAGDSRLNRMRFHSVLIDESTQAIEPDCIVPIVLGTKQLILVGDHKQLPPVVMCQKAADEGLSQSLFERLVKLDIKPQRLQIQYRMHPCLSEFPSNKFYEGTLQNGVSADQRKMKIPNFQWPQPNKPMFFYCCPDGQEEFAGSGTSFLNRKEALFVSRITTKFLNSGIKPKQIGVITPYEGQRAYLVDFLKYKSKGSGNAKLNEEIEVASIDAFQGREKDFIIFSSVRSNRHYGIGFLKDERRLNVGLTRAKYGLIVIGNPTTLSSNETWYDLLAHYKKNEVLMEGPLNKLKQSSL